MVPVNRTLRSAARPVIIASATMLVLATCSDPMASSAPPVVMVQPVRCSVTVKTKAVSCESGSAAISTSRAEAISIARTHVPPVRAPGLNAAILGGQNVYVKLTAVNPQDTGDDGNFNFDARVNNLTPEPMGTHNGLDYDGSGVFVFFDQGPNSPVTLAVPLAACCLDVTHSGEFFYQYDGILRANDSTPIQNWEFDYNGPAISFTFVVYVTANLPSDPALVTIPAHTFTQIEAGSHHGCAIRPSNVTYCWGDNSQGEIGDSTFIERTQPIGVLGNHTFTSISTGDYNSCALDAGGLAWCFGENDSSQLGDGVAFGNEWPVAVTGAFMYKQISVFAKHSCAVLSGVGDQQVKCWGSNEHGQLGTGAKGVLQASPVNVTVGGGTFSAIAVGATHTCGLKASGDLWCWGTNANGEMGNGSFGADVPNPGAAISGRQFSAISAGDSYNCGLDKTTSKAYCWGSNFTGQLGINSLTDAATPSLTNGGTVYTSVATGWFHTCALQSGAGKAFCWGANNAGQIGDGHTAAKSTPTAVAGTTVNFKQISTGFSLTCAITAANIPYCWGAGDLGQIGDNGSQAPVNSLPLAVEKP